eukprot:5597719-Amphidinium_carterae.1
MQKELLNAARQSLRAHNRASRRRGITTTKSASKYEGNGVVGLLYAVIRVRWWPPSKKDVLAPFFLAIVVSGDRIRCDVIERLALKC